MQIDSNGGNSKQAIQISNVAAPDSHIPRHICASRVIDLEAVNLPLRGKSNVHRALRRQPLAAGKKKKGKSCCFHKAKIER